MEELSLRPVEPERTDITTHSEYFRGIRYLYLEDIAALYRTFWDITGPAREERLKNLKQEQERLERRKQQQIEDDEYFASLEDEKSHVPVMSDDEFSRLKKRISTLASLLSEDKGYDDFKNEINIVRNIPQKMQAARDAEARYRQWLKDNPRPRFSTQELSVNTLEYYQTPEVSMKSDEFHFDDLEQLSRLKRRHLQQFEIRSKNPWNSVSIGGRFGVYISLDIAGPESEIARERIEGILRRRQSKLLLFIGSERVFGATLAGLLILILAAQYAEGRGIFETVVGWTFPVGAILFTSTFIGTLTAGRTRVIPKYREDAHTFWRDRGIEITIGAISAIAAVVAIVIAVVQG